MLLTPDDDLLAVASFMQENVPQSKIQAVADALPGLARLLWPNNTKPEHRLIRLNPNTTAEALRGDDLQQPPTAT